VEVGRGAGTIELRSIPDTNVKVIGHLPASGGQPADAVSFETFDPSGLVIEYGGAGNGKPLTPSGAATGRTWLEPNEECDGAGVGKPPTRFTYQSSAAGFQKVGTSIPAPTSTKASPMLADIDHDGRDDLIWGDTDKALSTPGNPITNWFV